jgi:hypothetical protein
MNEQRPTRIVKCISMRQGESPPRHRLEAAQYPLFLVVKEGDKPEEEIRVDNYFTNRFDHLKPHIPKILNTMPETVELEFYRESWRVTTASFEAWTSTFCRQSNQRFGLVSA